MLHISSNGCRQWQVILGMSSIHQVSEATILHYCERALTLCDSADDFDPGVNVPFIFDLK